MYTENRICAKKASVYESVCVKNMVEYKNLHI